MKHSVDPSTRIVTNKDNSELLEIKNKRVLNKRLRCLESAVEELRLEIASLKEKNTSVV